MGNLIQDIQRGGERRLCSRYALKVRLAANWRKTPPFGFTSLRGSNFAADGVAGAPIVAWARGAIASDASVVGSTFWVNTKPVTIAGIAPEGSVAAGFLFAMRVPVLANVPYVHESPSQPLLRQIFAPSKLSAKQNKRQSVVQPSAASRICRTSTHRIYAC